MTRASTEDIAWARYRKSGTWKNIQRRQEVDLERDRYLRAGWPRFYIETVEIYPVLSVCTPEQDWQRERAIPLPQELVDRLDSNLKEWQGIQEDIRQCMARQEVNPLNDLLRLVGEV